MARKKKQTNSLAEQLKEAESLLLANLKDAQYGKKLIRKYADLTKQNALSGVELQVTTKSITDSIDFGAVKVDRCAQGFLFTAKGGLQTLVSWRMQRVCGLIQLLFTIRDEFSGEELDEETRKYYQTVATAVQYVFQAPIFASSDSLALLDIATAIVTAFNASAERKLAEAEAEGATEETEQDVKDNIEAERQEQVFNQLIDEGEKLPNYDD
jgi:hypothetical protein